MIDDTRRAERGGPEAPGQVTGPGWTAALVAKMMGNGQMRFQVENKLHLQHAYRDATYVLGNELEADALAHELRSIYVALDYAICRECSLARAAGGCGGCTKHFLLEALAELADSLDGKCTAYLVQGVDIGLQLELDQRVNRAKSTRAVEQRRKRKRKARAAIASGAGLNVVKSLWTSSSGKERNGDGVLGRP